MGCNTSKDALVPVVEEGAAAAVERAKEHAAGIVGLEGIDPNDPEAQKAATKIQAAFRGHKTRKSMKTGDNQEDLEQEFDPNDQELCNAATKIQASFRGHMARKAAPKGKADEDLSKELQKLDAKEGAEEELDIDLTDPDLHKAATKIQASFRGHKARKDDHGAKDDDDDKPQQ